MKLITVSLLITMATAACSPAATPLQGNAARQGTTVRTSCPDHAPAFDDDPNHMVLVDERIIERVCILGASSEESRAAMARAIALREGDKLDLPRVRAALDALVALKTIEDASIGAELRGEGVVVFVDVREKQRIDEIVFEGMHAFDPHLSDKGPLERGAPLDRRVVSALARAIEAEYASRGYGGAKVEPAVEGLGAGHGVRLRFVVREGAPWVLSKLVFAGALKVSEADLRKTTTLTDGSPYDRDKIERASLLINALYYERGMIQVRIGEPKHDVALDGGVTVTWSIDEGDVFRVGTIRFDKLGEKMQKELVKEMKVRTNDVFDRTKFTADIAHIKTLFETRGQKVGILPQLEVDVRKKKVDLTISIEELKH